MDAYPWTAAEELLYRHLTEYQEKFRRVRFTLPDNSGAAAAAKMNA